MLYPVPRSVVRLIDLSPSGASTTLNNGSSTVFDVAFYPYIEQDGDVIFAVVAANEVFVCRPTLDVDQPVQVLRVFRHPQTDVLLNSLAWTQSLHGEPLICFAGAGSGKIQVANVKTGQITRILDGHGDAVNDLVVSPLSPDILVSGSIDRSIRVWNLDPKYEKHCCAAILGGDGHKGGLLAMAFHSEGRYLISGGDDTAIALWAVPDVPDNNAGTDRTTLVHYPLFYSNEVHSDYVDCVKFHGDLIFSHATSSASGEKENYILLWSIDGFNSLDPIPDNPPLPEPGKFTRSAFGKRFQRLLTFDMPNTVPFYMRFSLFNAADHRPILVMGDTGARFSFWDLQALEEGSVERSRMSKPSKKKAPRGHSRGRERRSTLSMDTAHVEGPDRDQNGDGNGDEYEGEPEHLTKQVLDPKRDLANPFHPIKPHHVVTTPKYNFTTRQIAWSNCGKWCVAVGELGLVWIFHRERAD